MVMDWEAEREQEGEQEDRQMRRIDDPLEVRSFFRRAYAAFDELGSWIPEGSSEEDDDEEVSEHEEQNQEEQQPDEEPSEEL